jgi:tetratricopeptide (TPR) repeat protein
MRLRLLLGAVWLLSGTAAAQPNCEWFKYNGEQQRYEACLEMLKISGHYQFSKAFQLALDSAIALDPTWAYPYSAKSTAYLKSGDFVGWKALIDKSVTYDSAEYLPDRAWCRFKFFADYEGAVADYSLLAGLVQTDWGHTGDGYYHHKVCMALCYSALGQNDTAMALIEGLLADANYSAGLYDHLHLGVMYLKAGRLQAALTQFEQQASVNNLAENQYYRALVYRGLNNREASAAALAHAKELYQNQKRMFDPYTAFIDQVYWRDLEAASSAE